MADDKKELTVPADMPKVGTPWRHVKTGNRYSVVAVGFIEVDLTPVVTYQRIDHIYRFIEPHAFTRPLAEWVEPVTLPDGTVTTRFVPD